MKKIVVSILCLLLLGSGAFALDKAAGGGVLVGGTFQGGGVPEIPGATWTFDRTSFGGFGFFSLSQYVEFNLAFMYKTGEASITYQGETWKSTKAEDGVPQPTTALGIGMYGKYPIPISDRFVFFPTGGVDFELNFEEYWWNDLWIRGGVGIDFFFSDAFFLRGHVIYGAAIPLGGELEPKVGHGFLAKAGLGFMF
ncbi:MAG: hypothetical protein LBF75_00550 [Treponema sp.]|nr:hypothetical protein [Treponema sp.]